MADGLLICSQPALKACTGFTLDVVRKLCDDFGLVKDEGRSLAAGLTMMHTDCSNEQLCVIYKGLFYEEVAVSTLFERVVRVLNKMFEQPMKTRCLERFNMADPVLGNITCILDGTALMVRLQGSEHGFKGKCANFQVFCTLDGELMTYSGPWTGRLTDIRNYCQDDDAERKKHCPEHLITSLNFVHYEDEAFSCDGIYKASLHCIVPYQTAKTTDAEFSALTTAQQRTVQEQQLWNQVVCYRRSRIERRFGQLDRHRFFHYTLRSIPMTALLFRAMWNAELTSREIEGPSSLYSGELWPSQLVQRHFGAVCTCNFNGMWYAGHPKRAQFDKHRDDLCQAYIAKEGMSTRMPRPSGHQSMREKVEQRDEMPLTQIAGVTEPRLFY